MLSMSLLINDWFESLTQSKMLIDTRLENIYLPVTYNKIFKSLEPFSGKVSGNASRKEWREVVTHCQYI